MSSEKNGNETTADSVDWEAAFRRALSRAHPDVERIDFTDDGHVVLQVIDADGERVRIRAGLSEEARRFLNGEFPELSEGGLPIRLLVPRPNHQRRDDPHD
jgi:hypothetical protein